MYDDFGGTVKPEREGSLIFFRCPLKGASGVPFPVFLLRCLISNYAGSRDLTRNASLAIRAKKIAPNAVDASGHCRNRDRDRCVGAGARLVGNGNVVDQATKSLCCGQNDCKEVPAADVIQPSADHRWHFSFAIDVAVRCPRRTGATGGAFGMVKLSASSRRSTVSWTLSRRVIGKAEVLGDKDNPRFYRH